MTLLLCILLAAVYFDIRTFRIPNRLIIFGIVLGVLYRGLSPGEHSCFSYYVGMVGMFFGLIPFYSLRAIGGGDVKLLSVCTLFTGWKCGLSIAIYAFLFGGIISVIYLVYHRFISKDIKKKRHVIHFSIPIMLGVLTQSLWGGFIWQI